MGPRHPPWKVDGLSHFTFGHAGYFKSTAFIDPVHELVVVMVRVGAGTNYDKYHPRFLSSIVDGMADRVPTFPEALTLTNLDVPAGQDRIDIETVSRTWDRPPPVLEYRYETVGTRWTFEPAEARVDAPRQPSHTAKVVAHFDPARASPLPMLRGAVFSENGPAPPFPARGILAASPPAAEHRGAAAATPPILEMALGRQGIRRGAGGTVFAGDAWPQRAASGNAVPDGLG